jgi:hypothetical protein
VKLLSFLTLAVYIYEWSDPHLGRFTAGKEFKHRMLLAGMSREVPHFRHASPKKKKCGFFTCETDLSVWLCAFT